MLVEFLIVAKGRATSKSELVARVSGGAQADLKFHLAVCGVLT